MNCVLKEMIDKLAHIFIEHQLCAWLSVSGGDQKK